MASDSIHLSQHGADQMALRLAPLIAGQDARQSPSQEIRCLADALSQEAAWLNGRHMAEMLSRAAELLYEYAEAKEG